MRKFLTGVLVFAVGAAAGLRADDDQSKKIALLPEQPRTMEQVIDRVTSNENHLYGKMREYSPLVETYIQNLKGDKDLGTVPAGDKYFLGKADFSKGVGLVPFPIPTTRARRYLWASGISFRSPCSICQTVSCRWCSLTPTDSTGSTTSSTM